MYLRTYHFLSLLFEQSSISSGVILLRMPIILLNTIASLMTGILPWFSFSLLISCFNSVGHFSLLKTPVISSHQVACNTVSFSSLLASLNLSLSNRGRHSKVSATLFDLPVCYFMSQLKSTSSLSHLDHP